ncbi:phosphoribosyltransferase [Mangrovihabitans endophyticus]|uniref:Phosphoribosyl transferase domain-containing protein n=1 Tax=Mangrovihabitans endophyticus TaxID=1751298 RepID=A0A8J3FSR7_9ACTN|nr:phosphoribosyltransferase [Mangrovihabitans endophyticus]GGL16262.1 hypothetical protein GCM10012284_58600 [Mangrovihabitans endophyticus]
MAAVDVGLVGFRGIRLDRVEEQRPGRLHRLFVQVGDVQHLQRGKHPLVLGIVGILLELAGVGTGQRGDGRSRRGGPVDAVVLERVKARRAGLQPSVSIENQIHTVHLGPSYRTRVKDKTVIVFDDFTTTGSSLEWAWNLFLAAGAREVIALTIGKYSTRYTTYDPKPGVSIDPSPFHAGLDRFHGGRTPTVGGFHELLEND